ncbi:CHAP domain-containing protein [Actinopolyspora xinjiangensis]|uniref:CHAP domain-containing protein n=1 Tax=Actinopolyspora xinjiangensis TaxID=405564 RepID=A0A1H0WYS0_9ACTN|nr:CHAP domain-containing protein [Actinopolyspora xinjiangensis]SDP95863.1 CHAP domain-containing protein [Actinopolyspora xinjiangensis]
MTQRGDRTDEPDAHRPRGRTRVLGVVTIVSVALATAVAVLAPSPPEPPPGDRAPPVIKADPGTVRAEIVTAARTELGTEETGKNCHEYSEQCVPWCSLFAMSTWERAGVDVEHEEFAFTGDVYSTGRTKGTAYDSGQLDNVRPGDVLLFGSGPATPQSSRHIGVVEKIRGETVTLIEGNTGDDPDRVMRKRHELNENTFYGGVHPW